MNGGGDTPTPTAVITSAKYKDRLNQLIDWPSEGPGELCSVNIDLTIIGENLSSDTVELIYTPVSTDVPGTLPPTTTSATEWNWHVTQAMIQGELKLVVNGEQYGGTVPV